MADLALDTLLHGNLDNLPTKPSSIVRIFTSSTFTGMSLSFPYGTYLDFHICFPFLSPSPPPPIFPRYRGGAQCPHGEGLPQTQGILQVQA